MEKLVAWQIPPGLPCTDGLPWLLERVRLLFNESIPYLETKPLKPLSVEDQIEWWNNLNHNETRLWVYTTLDGPDGSIVGFMKLTDRGSYVTPLFALDKKYWGRGYGEEIIQHYLDQAKPKPLRGSQLVSNGAICHMNKKAGWMIDHTSASGVQYLYHPNHTKERVPLNESNQAYLDYWSDK